MTAQQYNALSRSEQCLIIHEDAQKIGFFISWTLDNTSISIYGYERLFIEVVGTLNGVGIKKIYAFTDFDYLQTQYHQFTYLMERRVACILYGHPFDDSF